MAPAECQDPRFDGVDERLRSVEAAINRLLGGILVANGLVLLALAWLR